MSALSPKADIRHCGWNVRYVPKADVAEFILIAPSGAYPISKRRKNCRNSYLDNSLPHASAIPLVVVSFGGNSMLKIVAVVAALGLPFVSVPAFAQKKSCQEVCLKQCEAANAKNWCMQKCVPNCNMTRSRS
jgi:hypothetical protein